MRLTTGSILAVLVVCVAVPATGAAQDGSGDGQGTATANGHPTVGRITASVSLGYTGRQEGQDGFNPLGFPRCPIPQAMAAAAGADAQGPEPEPEPAAPCQPTAFEAAEKVDQQSDEDQVESNPFGLGVAARVGYTLESQLYLGLFAELDLGDKETATRDIGKVSTQASSILVGTELGVDLASGPVVVRPLVGVGLAMLSGQTCLPLDPSAPSTRACSDDSDLQMYFAPGLDLLWFLSDPVFVGVGGRFLGVTGPSLAIGATASATVGMAL